MAGCARTMRISFMYKSKCRIGGMNLGRVLIIPCEMFLIEQFRNTIIISLLGSVRGRVDDIGDSICQL